MNAPTSDATCCGSSAPAETSLTTRATCCSETITKQSLRRRRVLGNPVEDGRQLGVGRRHARGQHELGAVVVADEEGVVDEVLVVFANPVVGHAPDALAGVLELLRDVVDDGGGQRRARG